MPSPNGPPLATGPAHETSPAVTHSPTRDGVLAFLHGSASLEGRWFGDHAPYERGGRFWWRKHLAAFTDPIPMVLHCPSCGTQHIDQATAEWDNPPHRSHLCGSCGCIWQPADVPTVGVERIATCGKSDNWSPRWGKVDNSFLGTYSHAGDEGDLPPDPLLPACNKAPLGWRCTRGMGHDGFCATVEVGAPFQGGLIERQAVLEALAHHPACCTLVRRVPHARG